MKSLFLSIVLSLLLTPLVSAQYLETKVDTLMFYGDVLTSARLDKHKQFGAENFERVFGEILEKGPETFKDLKDLPVLSVKVPPDSSFVVYTWQLILNNNSDFRYFGYIQSLDGEFDPIRLNDRMQSGRVDEYASFLPDHWPGAFYYNMKPFILPDGNQAYLLFGINGNTRFNRIRIMDVLYRDDNQFVFGVPVFGEDPSRIQRTGKARIIMEYSYDAPVFLNFDKEYDLVVFNQVDRKEGIHPGQGMTGIPSGEYHGYRYEDGFWIYVPEVVRERSTPEVEPPAPPRQDRPRRDLFGRPLDGRR
jgi:hypothetical protein